MIILSIQEFQWINGPDDDPGDQCAHGRVLFRVNDTEFIKPEDGIWTVSASALYLLRTLSENHTVDHSVAEGNFLFPHCGFHVWLSGERFKVMCMGCSNGIDLEITHHKGVVAIKSVVSSEIVPESEWTRAVLAFADSVEKFYQSSLPKAAIEDKIERQGWTAFWQEWDERYQLAKAGG